jgi:hypothetical protein
MVKLSSLDIAKKRTFENVQKASILARLQAF